MTFRLILLGIFSLQYAHSHESGSGEVNRIEVTPFYDTIIFSDVADIINEFENNMNPLEAIFNSASNSEENIEDLLSEYQHYLDKAHKQRFNYLEKNKSKNKVPLLRRERYGKSKPGAGIKYDDYFYTNGFISPGKIAQTSYDNPLDLFIPVSQKLRYVNKPDLTTSQPKENREEMQTFEKRIIELPPVIPKSRYDPVKPCKQCLFPFDSISQNYVQRGKMLSTEADNKGLYPNADYTAEERLRDNDNTLNVRIKVDIQLPKTQELFGKVLKNRSREENSNSKESTVNLPFPYFNFPIPMDLFGYKKSSKMNSHDSSHKITIHKKKKSRLSSGNKKHRKKVITFHNLNLQPQQSLHIQPYLDDIYNNTDVNEKVIDIVNQTFLQNTTSTTQKPEIISNYTKHSVNKTKDITSNNETQSEDIFVMVNISNSSDNGTEDNHKIENSVETEYTKVDANVPTEKILNSRRKRDTLKAVTVSVPVSSTTIGKELLTKTKNLIVYTSSKPQTLSLRTNDTTSKKLDKAVLADSELMYWPSSFRNQTVNSSRNIITIILERENKKAKLNMTKETIRNNRTRALERAIFGDVNWDDVDTVAPVFLSFVGKYLRGVLTFCSQNICHSMKCAEKTCVHRTCLPDERWNHRGHCTGSNSTDSVASLESIMDLPSNIAFEIVDILQDKMLGKLFGKVTLCISAKCISFVASKKNFLKSKCSVKELKLGHCPNIKNFKIM